MAELKFLNALNCKVVRHKDPSVSVSGRPGTIVFNAEAAAKMGLTIASTIQVVFHGSFAYLLPNHTDGLQLREKETKVANSLLVQNAGFARGILSHLGFDDKTSYRFKIADKTDLKGFEVFELKKQSVLH
jgi:hypothetical protein